MAKFSKQASDFADLPLLTEVVDTDTEIPTLTEIIAKEFQTLIAQTAAPATLSDAECQQLAARIALKLEAQLREKLAPHFNALIQDALLEAQSSLPALIRATLSGKPSAATAQSAKITPSAVTPNMDQAKRNNAKHHNDGTRKKF